MYVCIHVHDVYAPKALVCGGSDGRKWIGCWDDAYVYVRNVCSLETWFLRYKVLERCVGDEENDDAQHLNVDVLYMQISFSSALLAADTWDIHSFIRVIGHMPNLES